MTRDLSKFIKENLKKAIEHREIQPFYQPVIRTSSVQLCSFEALARWINPELGMIYPNEFIPVLEQEGLIHLVDEAILTQVCARIRSSLTKGETPVPVSVNLSRLDFTLCDVFSVMDQIVRDYQIPHDFIYFEITESVMAENIDFMLGVVEQFRAAGYQIWMDDFGSAYSSLNALKEFPVDELKLDMCFLRPFTLRSKRIATAVVEMAKRIDIHTLIEGVETEEQFTYFRNIGCEKVQGYYFGKPMPYKAALENLREKGIAIEAPQDRHYYDEIGRIDFLSAVPFMRREEFDKLSSARQLNSIPLALAEFASDHFRVFFYNSAFQQIVEDSGAFPLVFTQEMLCKPQPYSLLSSRIINLMDSVKVGNGDGRMLFTIHEEYYDFTVRRMASTRERYCVLVRITNLSRSAQTENTGYLDEFVRRIYALFERITLIHVKEDNIRPLYMATRTDLLSGRKNIVALSHEYAEKYIYPEEREAYLAFMDFSTLGARLAEAQAFYLSALFRTSIRHGQYAWREYTLLQVEEDTYILMTRNVHNNVTTFYKDHLKEAPGTGTFAPATLWKELVNSDLLRIFWKDEERRFLGVSKAFLDYYDFPSEETVLGKTDEDLGWHVHPDLYKNDEYQVIHEGKIFHNMPGLCMNKGENRQILASKMPIYDENGAIRGLMGFFVDRELLTVNDKRGKDITRRDMLTGLLNTRGLWEEAMLFRDEYFLRKADFVRIHVSINDFAALNEQYGFDFADKILVTFGKALKQDFGRNCAVGRITGHTFTVLKQAKAKEEAQEIRDRIRQIAESIKTIDGTAVTLYLSVGYAFFSEYLDLEEQSKMCDVRLHADHDKSISAESRLSHSAEIFHMFDDLPIAYSVYHVARAGQEGQYDAVIFYVNHKFEEDSGLSAKECLGRSIRELFPYISDDWFEAAVKAAFQGESGAGDLAMTPNGQYLHYTAHQIIYPGYCAFTYQELRNYDGK